MALTKKELQDWTDAIAERIEALAVGGLLQNWKTGKLWAAGELLYIPIGWEEVSSIDWFADCISIDEERDEAGNLIGLRMLEAYGPDLWVNTASRSVSVSNWGLSASSTISEEAARWLVSEYEEVWGC